MKTISLWTVAVLTVVGGTAGSTPLAPWAPTGGSAVGEAAAGTITGSVHLTGLDGEVREDRSEVLVFLDGVRNSPNARAGEHAQIVQSDGAFTPRLLPVIAGTVVSFPNDDDVFHNIFSLSKTRPFDLGVYGSGESQAVGFPETGLVRVFCNLHPEMAASVLVLNNSHYTVTDGDGTFEIRDVPAGTYTLRTWHRLSSEQRAEVSVTGGGVTAIDLRLQEDRRVVPHTNKFGKRYRRKY